jgi:AraC family transcriptional regulator, activator of mtrCDE
MPAPFDKIVHWLLSSLEPVSSLFHVGQYCGDWRASTSGCARASFHVVLHGACWLHFADGRASLRVESGEAVFLLRDVPHCLSADRAKPASGETVERRGTMEALDDALPGAVGLACGFFDFRGSISHWIVSLLPEYLIVRQGDPAYSGVHAVFELIRAEARREGELSSPLIDRLVELLLFYAVRDAARHDAVASGLASLMRRTEFATLIAAIIDAPSETWTTASMAAFSNMSRATFFKRFTEACGHPPAQFVTLMRMKIAGELLNQGWNIPRTAEYVGYQSESAFAHAFKRMTGVQPGAWRRVRDSHLAEETTRMHVLTDAPQQRLASVH